MTTMTDADLLALYERTVDELYRYASRLTGGDATMADEIVQETYLALLRKIREGHQETVDVGWLIVSCRHRYLDQLKRDARGRARELRAVGRPHTEDDGGRAVDALADVPADQRAVLVLRYVDEMTVSEVAHTMGRSVHATESLLARARATLRSILAQGVK
jgi:RNA polymerase sigma-70 factor (ECF subfamily)